MIADTFRAPSFTWQASGRCRACRFRSCSPNKQQMNWTLPLGSSFGSDFNADFNVWIGVEQQHEGAEYNYPREPLRSDVFRCRNGQEGDGDSAEGTLRAACGVDVLAYDRDRSGMSAFTLEDGAIYHNLFHICARR
jgi:predicted dithiol-disulfide oxidoreductase (DUF899 family)